MRYRRFLYAPAALAALLASLTLLAACSGSSGGTSARATTTATADAQALVQKTKAAVANIKDATFNVQLLVGTAGASTAVSGSGTGKLTRSPDRIQMQLTGTFAGQQGAVSFITDKATGSAYVQTPQTNGKWVKIPAATLGTTTDVGNFALQNATLVGEETINGQPTYHLRGTQMATASAATPSSSNATPATAAETTDVWVNKTTYNPVRLVTKSQDGSSTVTIDFTGVNTGATIDVPSGDQVVSAP